MLWLGLSLLIFSLDLGQTALVQRGPPFEPVPGEVPLPAQEQAANRPVKDPLPFQQADVQPAVDPLPVLEPALQPVVDPLPVLEPALQPVVDPLPVLKPALQPVVAPLPVLEPALQPVVDPLPVLEPALQPVVAPLPVLEPALQPVVDPLPVLEPALQPVVDPLPVLEPQPETGPSQEPTDIPLSGDPAQTDLETDDSKSTKTGSGSADAKSSRTGSDSSDLRSSKTESGSSDVKSSRIGSGSIDAKSSRRRRPRSADVNFLRTGSGSADAKSPKTGSGSGDLRSSRTGSDSSDLRSSRTGSDSSDLRSSRTGSGSIDVKSSRRRRPRSADVNFLRTGSGSADGKSLKTGSGSVDANSPKTGSGSVDGKSPKIGSGSADANSPKTGSGSADGKSLKTGSGSADGKSLKTGSGSVDANSPKTGSGSADANSPKTGSGSADANSPKTGSGSADGKSPKTGSGSADGKAPKTGSGSADGKSPKTGSGSADGKSPKTGSGSADGKAPKTGSGSADGKSPKTGSSSADGKSPKTGSGSADGKSPKTGSGSADAEAPRTGSGSSGSKAPRTGSGPNDARVPRTDPDEGDALMKSAYESKNKDGGVCRDILSEDTCSHFKSRGMCTSKATSHVRVIQVKCRRTCGLCKDDSSRCLPGFLFDEVQKTCLDVDECAKGTAVCAANAKCVNKEGSYGCVCDTGFVGYGKFFCQAATLTGATPAANSAPKIVPPHPDGEIADYTYFNEPPPPPQEPKGKPLGVESDVIPDDALTCSSSTPTDPPTKARPNSRRGWRPDPTDTKPYLTVDLGKPMDVHGLGTLGHYSDLCWVTNYIVLISLDGENFTPLLDIRPEFSTEPRNFVGNTDQNTWKKHCLHRYYGKPVNTRYVRFQPLADNGCTGMRVELYGFRDGNDPALLEVLKKDAWTRNTTGCICYFDNKITECACCQAGGCQCPRDNLHQCVQCGYGMMCGIPEIKTPEEQLDPWTLSGTGCVCPFDESRTDCACCQRLGCQCGRANKNQCVTCGHPEDCGRKEEVFGPNETCVPKYCPAE